MSPMSPVQNGIPQGSPISPILASFYTADIAERYRQNIEPFNSRRRGTTKPTLLFYVDDGNLYTASTSIERNYWVLRTEFTHIREMLIARGLSDDIDKRELMNYSRARKPESIKLWLPGNEGEEVETKPAETIRWLGIFFDRKLSFNYHVDQLAAKGERAVQCLQILGNTIRGLSPTHLRTLFSAC